MLLLHVSSLQCPRPSSDEGRLWKGSRQRLQRSGNGGVRAGAGRQWPATQPPGLQIRSDMSKCGAQFHNHCSALHQRQAARQYGCVTPFLTRLLFPPCSYCLSASNKEVHSSPWLTAIHRSTSKPLVFDQISQLRIYTLQPAKLAEPQDMVPLHLANAQRHKDKDKTSSGTAWGTNQWLTQCSQAVFSAATKGLNLTCFNHIVYLKTHVFPEKFGFVFAVYNGYTSQGMHLWHFLLHRGGISLCAVKHHSVSCILCLFSLLERLSH